MFCFGKERQALQERLVSADVRTEFGATNGTKDTAPTGTKHQKAQNIGNIRECEYLAIHGHLTVRICFDLFLVGRFNKVKCIENRVC